MRNLFRLVFFSLTLLSLVAILRINSTAQGRGRTSSSLVPLQVRVVYSNDRAVTMPVTVQLISGNGVPVLNGVTNDSGALQFTGVRPGDYQLEVTAPGIQRTLTGMFTILGDEHFHMETVTVQPEQSDDSGRSPGAPGTVSAASMNIPQAAKDEFRKGAEALSHNDLPAGRSHFGKAIEDYPRYSGAYDGLGIVLARMGETSEALKDLQKAVELDDHNVQACINLSRLDYRAGNFVGSESALSKALTADPQNVQALALMSNLEFRAGRYQDAVATEHRIHVLPHADYTSAHVVAASALQAQKLWSEAAAEYELYLKESPNGPSADEVRRRLQWVKSRAQAKTAPSPH